MSELASEVRRVLAGHGIKLNKDLGQHFLIDESVLRDILDAALLKPGERVVEVGAGLGILTRELLRAGACVTSIELDRRWIFPLQVFTGHPKELDLIEGDALDVTFPDEPYKIVANIPYQITSPLLRHAFLDSPRPPLSATLLIQREVAERICDPKEGNLLRLAVSLFGEPRIVRHVPSGSFLPPPKVDSSVLHIACYAQPLLERSTLDRTLSIAKLGFSQKRKMLRNTVGSLPDGMERMKRANIDPTRRPQTLSLTEWTALAGNA
jgi:16S rRNA (adenine1518-N6/adenine1519-N6)-dimethyltransferase